MRQNHHEISIGGHDYLIKKMDADKATRVLFRLAEVMGEPIIVFMGAGAGGGKPGSKQVLEILPKAFRGLMANADEDKFMGLLKVLLEEVHIKSMGSTTAWSQYKLHFQGRIMDALKLAVEVVNFNYENFFDEVASLAGGPAEATNDQGSESLRD